MVLQDCPLLMLAQGQTWSFTPVSAWKNNLAEYPAGTVWEWSVAFRFEPYED